jgi:thioredoxin reductase (NADPH)
VTDAPADQRVLGPRHEQAFPRLSLSEIDRLRRFGELRTYSDNERLFSAGQPGLGLFVVLRGLVAITHPDGLGHAIPIVEQGEGQFLAEIGALSGKAALVDGWARGEVETLVLSPAGLRAALVAEALLGERIMRALVLRRVSLIETGAGVLLIGQPDDHATARLMGFLTRNGMPHRLLEPKDAQVHDIIAAHPGDVLPIAVTPEGRVLERPDEARLAAAIGMTTPGDLHGRRFDVAIVGAGPAGLAAAVYATSEGLSVVVLDSRAFGGQAGASARIENYLGFPTGISGQALAGRAYTQAVKFGAEMAVPMTVSRLSCEDAEDGRLRLDLEGGASIEARAVVLAAGARYRRLEVKGLEQFEGRGISYWASPIEARMALGQEVLLVGGGNSAGQAAVFLSEHAARVRVLVRHPLGETMSQYLVDRIAAAANIEVIVGAMVTGLVGRESLERVRWRGPQGEVEEPVRHLFLFIGADPASGWLDGCGVLRERGFVATGDTIPPDALEVHSIWRHRRPAPLETSVPGVFAIGDVRAGSVKRVGAAIGEGAAVVAQIHAHLAAQQRRR